MSNRKKLLFIPILLTFVFAFLALFYYLWSPGHNVTDGRHDLKSNGIWIQHGWLGDDLWFVKNKKKNGISFFRNPDNIQNLASLLIQHNITDVYPHLCPTSVNGEISGVDHEQTNLFLDIFRGFRVMPWVGGVIGKQAFPDNAEWRRNFTGSVSMLLESFPQFAGIHINIEPCPDDYEYFLVLLDEVRSVLPKEKILSVSAFPPPVVWNPFTDVRWSRGYYNQVAQRTDQLVVMMYDTGIRFEKGYQYVMAKWTREILEWANCTKVLFGLPAYEDKGFDHHDPAIENLRNSLLGIHAGLNRHNPLPAHYQGVSIYCEWEMDNNKWEILRANFKKNN